MTDSPPRPSLSRQEFARISGVSAPVLARLEIYVELLIKWQKRINLVGGKTLDDVWRRHIQDSAQLHPLLPSGGSRVLDMGSGAGFPGLVLAIMGGCTVHLVESDSRKCAFLFEATGQTQSDNVRLHNTRMETLAPFSVDVVTSRALAPLDKLLEMAEPFVSIHTFGLFLKGRKAEQELTEARKNRTMTSHMIQSQTNPSGTILKLSNIQRKP